MKKHVYSPQTDQKAVKTKIEKFNVSLRKKKLDIAQHMSRFHKGEDHGHSHGSAECSMAKENHDHHHAHGHHECESKTIEAFIEHLDHDGFF